MKTLPLELKFSNIHIYAESEIERSVRTRPLLHEPKTIRWIRTMPSGSILWDIGANVGIYSLVAAESKKCSQIISIEPAHENFIRLCQNIQLNGYESAIAPLNLATHSINGIGKLYSNTDIPGDLAHFIDREQVSTPMRTRFVATLTLDSLVDVFHVPVPTHIKIDVDGAELEVLKGAHNVLESHLLKSVNIEIDEYSDCYPKIVEIMSATGFSLACKYFDPIAAKEEGNKVRIMNYIYSR